MNEVSTLQDLKPLVVAELDPPLDYLLIEDETGLEHARGFLERSSVFAIDCETNMVDDFFYRRIRTIQFGDKNKQFIIDLLPFAKRAGVSLMESQGQYSPHPCFNPIIDLLRPVLDMHWTAKHKPLKVGHNLRFDYEVLKWCLGLRMWNLYDTMYAEKVLHAGEWNFRARGIWALDDCVARYAGLRISKEEQTSFDLSSPLTTEQVVYCALDCRLPLAVKNAQHNAIIKANLSFAVQIENDAIPAFGDIHLNGMLIDKDAWMAQVNKIRGYHKRHVAKLDEFFVPVVGTKAAPENNLEELETIWRETKDKELRAIARKAFMAARKKVNDYAKHEEDYEGEAFINYGSPKQLLAALRKMGYDFKQLPDSEDPSLKKLSEHPKWDLNKVLKEDPDLKQCGLFDTLRLYRETSKVLGTYGEIWCTTFDEGGHINPGTGRIHSDIDQCGADTGRSTSKDPNVQNLPHDPVYRDAFIAEPGHKIITADYNGCELRILTEYSREPAWLDAFLHDWDVHSVGAEILFGKEWKDGAEEKCAYYAQHQKCKCKKHKELRNKVKALNFGIAYGLEHKSLAEQLDITEDEAKDLLKRYKAAFPILMAYLKASGDSAKMKLEARTLAQRRRLFPKPTWVVAAKRAQERMKKYKREGVPDTRKINQAFQMMYASIERQGKNTPIQGSNADMAKLAMGCGIGKDGLPYMWHRLEPEFKAKLINFVHDETVTQSEEHNAVEVKDFVCGCMSRAGGELVKSIPMPAEAVIADRWKKE